MKYRVVDSLLPLVFITTGCSSLSLVYYVVVYFLLLDVFKFSLRCRCWNCSVSYGSLKQHSLLRSRCYGAVNINLDLLELSIHQVEFVKLDEIWLALAFSGGWLLNEVVYGWLCSSDSTVYSFAGVLYMFSLVLFRCFRLFILCGLLCFPFYYLVCLAFELLDLYRFCEAFA